MIVWRLAFANLKKKKNLTFTLVFLSLLAVLFLNLGLILQEEMQTAYSHCAGRLNSPDFVTVMESSKYKSDYEAFLKQDKRVEYVEKEEIIYMQNTKNNVNSLKSGAVIFNKDAEREIESMHLLKEDTSVPEEKAIYLPRILEDSGAVLGEEFILTYKNIEYKFQVAGFCETTYMGTTGYALMKYFIPQYRFDEMYETAGTGKALSIKLKEGLPKVGTSRQLKKDFLDSTNYFTEIGGILAIATCLSYYDMEDSIISIMGIPMIILVSMALLIGVINFIIVFFKVKESIDESMINIGSLQAMGYTTWQMMLSEIMQFSAIGFTGGIGGLILTYIVLPSTLQYGEGMVGIAIKQGIHIAENVFSACLILVMMAIGAILGAWKIRKISPVTALRKGVQTHHFGKNFFPLQNGRSSIYFRLALKNISRGFRQSFTTILIVGLGVFAIALSVVLYGNFGYDSSAIIKMTGMEIADVQLKPLAGTDVFGLTQEIESMDQVRKTSMTESYMAKIEDEDVQFMLSDHFELMETLSVSEGDSPKYDNEIVLTASFLQKLNKKLGDTVNVTARGITREYLIVGSSAGTNNNGKMGMMSLEGIQRIDKYYTLNQINIYLKEGTDTKKFIDMLYEKYGIAGGDGNIKKSGEDGKYKAAKQRADEQIKKLLDQYGVKSVSYAVMQDGKIILSGDSSRYAVKEVTSLSEYLDGQLASYTSMMTGIMAMILIVMLLVMGTIISITIKTRIRSKREDLGIYKSMGYTTRDLVKIIRLEFMVNAVIGSALGILFCRLLGNSILTAFFNTLGLSLSDFAMKTVWLAAIGILSVLYVYLLTTLKAYQVKHVTVYELLTE